MPPLPPALRPSRFYILPWYILQTLRSAIAGIDKHRQEVTSHHLHAAYSITDIHGHGSEDLHSVALARASVTASFHEKLAINTTNECGGAEENVIAGAVNPADPDFHEPAAIHLVSLF